MYLYSVETSSTSHNGESPFSFLLTEEKIRRNDLYTLIFRYRKLIIIYEIFLYSVETFSTSHYENSPFFQTEGKSYGTICLL